MLIYDLVCGREHAFEGWFQSAEDYEAQLRQGLLRCPLCDSDEVGRVPSPSHLRTNTNKASPAREEAKARQAQALQQLRDYLQRHSEHVGERFAEEARRIHYGEAEARNIHGTASHAEVAELHAEGIHAVLLPLSSLDKRKQH